MSSIQKALEIELDNLLENIKGEWNETVSRNEELFFQNRAYLNQYNDEKARGYSNKYNEIIMGRDV